MLNIEINSMENRVSGWLKFFLWVGVGLGALLSVVTFLVQISDLGWFLSLLYFVQIASLVAIAILTIKAFYRGQTNAVSLAMTYIAMIVIDGAISLLFACTSGDSSTLTSGIKQFVWAAIWFAFLRFSSDVKQLIPAESRTWQKTEKVLLAVYATASFIFVLL